MKIIKYSLVALFTLCLTNLSFAATEATPSKPAASTKPSCGCQGKGAQGTETDQKQSTQKPA